ncbi:MAG: response regulator [Lachnospiraceae bacterium]|nr:response regulator [Lachnospiraceae bacterium]
MISSNDIEIAMNHAQMLYWVYDIQASTAHGSKMVQEWFGTPQLIENYPDEYLKYDFVAKENIEDYREACHRIQAGETYVEFDARIRTLQQGYVWMRIRMTGIKGSNNQPERAICTAERIAEYKELENRFSTTLHQHKIASWRYDLTRHTIILNQETYYNYYKDNKGEIPNIPESQIEEGLCHPEDVEILRRLYRRMDEGERNVEETLRFMDSQSQTFRWKKCIYTVIVDGRGKPTYAIGSSIDMTEEIEAERQYEAALEYRKRTQKENLLLSGHCSVTKNKIIEMTDLTGLTLLKFQTKNRSDFFEQLKECILSNEKKKEFEKLFTNDSMEQNFEKGIHESTLTCEISLDGEKRIWTKIHVNAIRTPDTGDLEGFLTVTDITKNHVEEQLLHRVVECDYDYIMMVDIPTNQYRLYSASEDDSMSDTPTSGDYFKEIEKYAYKYVVPEDRKIAIDEMTIEYLREKLKNQDVYEAQARLIEPDGSVSYKQVKFSYLDEGHTQLLITRVDITSLILEEEKKRAELSEALRLAEGATKAKTDFFARMSHDMRTPLNGILGSVSLAIDCEEHTPQMAEYLHDIQFSGDFLLNLINDVLDMSKIESGVMELFPEEYAYSEFISNMTKMIEPLCKKKNITLNMNPMDNAASIRVDILRFQQIFFNVFSNAVKYTPEGGTIDHYTEVELIDANHIDCKCHIVDNGIGMSEEFQKHLFDPYSRENQNFSTVQGTGLGLSIANNLAHMMGGEVIVKSELGKGTEVIIHTVLEIIEPSKADKIAEEEHLKHNKEALRGCHILLCEDHPLNAKITIRLLEKWGAIVEHAENGELGVKMFTDSPTEYYDLILMDIRMPVMDGLQAAMKIRRTKRPDAETVPIIAMTANAYETDIKESKKAGMNTHLAKPIVPERFYEAILQVIK